ncbi:MAG: YqiA/YcfP family alpha/beta fold hydrolase [Kofleriaceae bacterium]
MQVLYLPGFASGPSSTKAVAFADHFAARGITLDRMDLRKPSFEHLRLSAMIDHVLASLRGPAVLIGSSLGGLTAARASIADDRVKAVVLLAPAFRLALRWQQQLGPEWDEWKRTGWREVYDYSKKDTSKVDFGFMEDVISFGTEFPDVKVPALVIHGTADKTVPIEFSRSFLEGRPNASLIELSDGHQLLDSIPRLLAETDRFLAPYLK